MLQYWGTGATSRARCYLVCIWTLSVNSLILSRECQSRSAVPPPWPVSPALSSSLYQLRIMLLLPLPGPSSLQLQFNRQVLSSIVWHFLKFVNIKNTNDNRFAHLDKIDFHYVPTFGGSTWAPGSPQCGQRVNSWWMRTNITQYANVELVTRVMSGVWCRDMWAGTLTPTLHSYEYWWPLDHDCWKRRKTVVYIIKLFYK